MSGVPNPDGVNKLRQAFRDFAWTRERIAELHKSIADAQATLDNLQLQLRKNREAIKKELEEMDVSSPGNHGWEQRYFELLLTLSEIR